MAGYDVLHIQEQQFLKCCAVLGDSFRRSKLLFVWKCTDTRKFNLGMNVVQQRYVEIYCYLLVSD